MEKLTIERDEFKNKTFRLNVKLLQQLECICADKNISLNRLVTVCLRYAIDNYDRGEQNVITLRNN